MVHGKRPTKPPSVTLCSVYREFSVKDLLIDGLLAWVLLNNRAFGSGSTFTLRLNPQTLAIRPP